MRTLLQVLSEAERNKVHECSLQVLAKTGLRVETGRGRAILAEAGAEVDHNSHLVRFPRRLVEEALRLAPRKFSLGGRRPGYTLPLNSGECVLLADGGARFTIDVMTGQRRPGTYEDWLDSTRLIDALDAIGLYWWMTEGYVASDTTADLVAYWINLFRNFSKHIQDVTITPEQSPWLGEVLQVVFGSRETVRRQHPWSFLLCPQSPLILPGAYTDAYLELAGWDIPVAVMPMPMLGTSGPGSLVANTVLGNSEVLAMLCLVQAAAPGTPFIYAPVMATMDPRSARYMGGAVENGILSAATTEMGRYYGLPVEASTGAADHYVPGIQSSYEKAMNTLLGTLAWPDILVGPGLLGAATALSLEQVLIDVEIFTMCQQAQWGIDTDEDKWLLDVIDRVGHGGTFLMEPSTIEAIREGYLYVSKMGVHKSYEEWVDGGKITLLEQVREKVNEILANHEPLPLSEEVEQELERIRQRAEQAPQSGNYRSAW